MADTQSFQMRCPFNHEWVETYPTDHTLFGVCPRCPGKIQGRVLKILDPEETPPKGAA